MNGKKKIMICASLLLLSFALLELQTVAATPMDSSYYSRWPNTFEANTWIQDDIPFNNDRYDTSSYNVFMKINGYRKDSLNFFPFTAGLRIRTKFYVSARYCMETQYGNYYYWAAPPYGLFKFTSASYTYESGTDAFTWQAGITWKAASFTVAANDGGASISTNQWSIEGEYAYLGYLRHTEYFAGTVTEFSSLIRLIYNNDIGWDYGAGSVYINGYKTRIVGFHVKCLYEYYSQEGVFWFKDYEFEHILGSGNSGDVSILPFVAGTPAKLI